MSIIEIINKHHSEITHEEWSFLKKEWIVNWCGGKWSFIRPPYKIFFIASCNKHDLWYYIGWDEKRRKECDIWFLQAMFRDAEKKWILEFYYKSRALLFYIAVRIFWSKYFNYTWKND